MTKQATVKLDEVKEFNEAEVMYQLAHFRRCNAFLIESLIVILNNMPSLPRSEVISKIELLKEFRKTAATETDLSELESFREIMKN
jgi:hypothetical protein